MRLTRSARLAATAGVLAAAIIAGSCGADLSSPGSTTLNGSAITVTTGILAAGTTGAPYSQTLQAAGGTAAYTWTLESGALPAGLTLSSTGDVTGTPTTVATSNFTVGVSSGTASASRAFTIVVTATNAPPGASLLLVNTTTLPGATLSVAYNQTLQATGGTAAITWSVLSGTLPAGLSFSSAGQISGVPATIGTSNFTVLATSGIATAAQALSITVSGTAASSVSITTTSLPGATIGTFYNQPLKATGGNGSYTWTQISGTLPGALTISSAGQITGIPTAPTGSSTFTVQVSSAGAVATQALTINVSAPPLAVVPPGLAPIPVFATYSHGLQATGGLGTYTWSVASGGLPPGITLSTGGLLSGSPTTIGADTFTVQVASGTQTATLAIGMTIVAQPPLVANSLPLFDAIIGQAYHANLSATGGTGTYTWSITAGVLPAGIVLGSGGSLSGTATTQGTSHLTFQVASGTQTASQALTLSAEPPLGITTASVPGGTVGVGYSQTISATGGNGTYAWAVMLGGALPTGLTLSGGTISGTPQSPGTFNFQIQVTSGTQITVQAFNVTIQPGAPVVITTQGLPGGYPNAAYSQQLTATGGSGTYVWSLISGALPGAPGVMTLSPSGVISGTPTGIQVANFTVQVSSGGDTVTMAMNLTISQVGVVTITTITLSPAQVGIPYSMPLLASGGSVYTWALAGANPLPAGLSLSAAGLITGTPTTAGTPSFSVTVTSGAQQDSRTLTLTISP